ncbi:bifunctional diguanylate cyclase/phosphodiesterase [Methylobacter psychrophilus]|uniref:bifunctional diguanylate cyclase/phosphodiesterase n=1 Tax=Methylobacter psychrophilus TaxID=96941 RepID=UPI0021D50836|nr:LapD/MoxY N-terminal periplasmic domain-containing protein [Methylobacter psychrophilus]
MSLSKQLLILISALFLILFSVNFVLSVKNIKTYLEGESQSHAQDTATSLGLSLSPYMMDTSDPIIKTMVSAIFDMGYYQEIRLVDANNKELISLTNGKSIDGVPSWFISYLPMPLIIAQSEISYNWMIRGVVYVTINPSFAYSKLYQQAKTSFYYSLMTFALSIILLVLLLQITLSSLKRINDCALHIADGHFETIENLPWTTEVRNITVSINKMSKKIENTIIALNSKLDKMGASLLRDDLTGLYKKAVFETDIMNLMMAYSPAYLMIIRVDSLPNLARERGNDIIDELLQAVAEKLKISEEQHADTIMKTYRFYGGEFAMLIKNANSELIESIAKALSNDFFELGEKYAKSGLTHIGIAPVNSIGTPESILESAHEAYEQARLIGPNSYYIRSDESFARDIFAWKELVFNCIDNADYSLSYVGQITCFQTEQLVMEEAFTQVHDKSGQLVAIGPFISIAEKLAKIIDLDKGVINKVLDYIFNAQISHAVAVNLSTDTIKNIGFRLWLEKLIKNNPLVTQQLVFSFSAYAVAQDLETYIDFIDVVHQWGGRVMIKRFESQSMPPELTKKLNPDFIRLAREIGNGISLSEKKYRFVQAIQQMGVLLDITVLAENVHADNDYLFLKTIGIAGASR